MTSLALQLRLASRYLLGRKMRSLLTTLSIIFGVMIIFGLNGMLPAVKASFQQNLNATAGLVDITLTSNSRGVFDQDVVDRVAAVAGVEAATGALIRPILLPEKYALPGAAGDVKMLIVSGLDPQTVTNVRAFPLQEGRLFQPGAAEVIIPTTLAQSSGLVRGDSLALPTTAGQLSLTITGLTPGRPAFGAEMIYVPLTTAQEMLNAPGMVNTVEARLQENVDSEVTRAAVLAGVGPGFKIGGNKTGTELQAAVESADLIFLIFGIIAMTMGGFIIFNTFRTIVMERRRDIGMLRALGASRRTITVLILSESLLQGLIGTALGLLLGFLVAYGLLVVLAPLWENLIQVNLGPPHFLPYTYLLSIVLGLGTTLLGGLLPALAAGRVTPLTALRPLPADVERERIDRQALLGLLILGGALAGLLAGGFFGAAVGIVLLIIALVLIGPLLVFPLARIFGRLLVLALAREGHIARGNLTRQPDRAAITATSMMIGLALIVAMGGLISSLNTGLRGWIEKGMGADYLFMPQSIFLGSGNIGAGPEFLQAVDAVDGVGGATTMRIATSRSAATDLQVVGIDPLRFPQLSGLNFSAGEEAVAYAALAGGRAIIVNGLFAVQNGLEVGQTIPLSTPQGEREYEVVAVGSDFLNMKLATGYISQENLARDFNSTTDLMVMVDRTETADSAAVTATLTALSQDYPSFTLYTTEEWLVELDETALSKLDAVYLLMIMLAAPSLIALVNTLAINVLERTREIGMIRAVGGTRRQIARMILGESLLLAAMGTVLGILTGIWLGHTMVNGFQFTGFDLPYHFPYVGIVVTIVVGLLFGIIGALVPARRAARADIVTALAYE